MNLDKILQFFENSFLKELLIDNHITDIAFNGDFLTYQHNQKGRIKSEIEITKDEVFDFLRQLANLSEKQFSFQNPILDISFSKYRLNAIHHSICRKNNEPCCSFALRISSTTTSLFDKDFMDDYVKDLLIELVKSNLSIVIGGKTSSGKTEIQKFLIKNAPTNCRIVVIDNVLELDQAHTTDIDLTFWQYDDQSNRITISNLIKNALRNNPDYLIVAESRGEEMVDVLNSAMTGHPIITTLHASSVNNMTSRMAEMVMMNDKKFDYQNVINNINRHLQVFVYTKIEKTSDGIKRFISDVNYHDEDGNIHVLFTKSEQIRHYYKLPKKLLSKINNSSLIEKFKEN